MDGKLATYEEEGHLIDKLRSEMIESLGVHTSRVALGASALAQPAMKCNADDDDDEDEHQAPTKKRLRVKSHNANKGGR